VRTLTIIQSAWAAVLGLAGGFLAFLGNPFGYILISVAVVYSYAILSLHRLERWAWWFCCALTAAPILMVAPGVVYNFALFAVNDPLYLDSPGTILVVATNALVLVVPALLVLVLLLSRRGLLAPNKSLERTRDR